MTDVEAKRIGYAIGTVIVGMGHLALFCLVTFALLKYVGCLGP